MWKFRGVFHPSDPRNPMLGIAGPRKPCPAAGARSRSGTQHALLPFDRLGEEPQKCSGPAASDYIDISCLSFSSSCQQSILLSKVEQEKDEDEQNKPARSVKDIVRPTFGKITDFKN